MIVSTELVGGFKTQGVRTKPHIRTSPLPSPWSVIVKKKKLSVVLLRGDTGFRTGVVMRDTLLL